MFRKSLDRRRLLRQRLGRSQRRYRVADGQKLHGDHAPVVELRQLAIDVGVIDLAGAGLVAAWDVGYVNEADHVDVLFELLDQVALGDLLVKYVVEKLDLRVVDGADDFDSFGGRGEEVLRILFGVDALEQQADRLAIDLLAFDYVSGALERFDRGLCCASRASPGIALPESTIMAGQPSVSMGTSA